MTRSTSKRTTSLAITLFGSVTNLVLGIQLLATWRSLRWEPESEWESSGWRINGLKVVWGLLSAYFLCAATLSAIGLWGIVKNKSSYVRLYRDYSVADFTFTTFFTLVGTYTAFQPNVRTGACEALSRQPELMRDMAEMGLNVENCELWFERAVLVAIAGMFILIVIRLHFLIAVSNFYSHLSRYHQRSCCLPTHCHAHSQSQSHCHSPRTRSKSQDSIQRIYLLPRFNPLAAPSTSRSAVPEALPASSSGNASSSSHSADNIIVYAPVALSSLTPLEAQSIKARATEAWVAAEPPQERERESRGRGHKHRHSHHQHKDQQGVHFAAGLSQSEASGQISLPIEADEPLLPGYDDVKSA
ncbi:hypothetical protein HGRIS_010106 [Hohenbuehelia grisea]|uniref:Uncharacterized protein n=1 Tax=Hohenbuehelia grisea TaxID=104357 RepID=A0ABR3J3I3_9AGAR